MGEHLAWVTRITVGNGAAVLMVDEVELPPLERGGEPRTRVDGWEVRVRGEKGADYSVRSKDGRELRKERIAASKTEPERTLQRTVKETEEERAGVSLSLSWPVD